MFKRVLKIILILLGAFALTLLIIWLIGRGKSHKAGQTPLSFKQFLGLSTKTNTGDTLPGETSSTFTGADAGNTGIDANGNTGGFDSGNLNGLTGTNNTLDNNSQISQFTSGGITAAGGGLGGGLGGGGGISGGGGLSGGTGGNTGGTGGTAGGTGGTSGNTSGGTGSGGTSGNTGGSDSASTGTNNTTPICSTEDTNIDFTPAELAKLNELQNRFYTIAQSLHTDADVETEIANHDAFTVKADQATELYAYCESKLHLITDPHLQQHVPTPFWHDENTDSLSLIDFSAGGGLDVAHLTDVHDNNHDASHNADTSNIKGPYGVLTWSNPQAVAINGSILTGQVVTLPGRNPITVRQGDIQLLVPVVEKILRINLW